MANSATVVPASPLKLSYGHRAARARRAAIPVVRRCSCEFGRGSAFVDKNVGRAAVAAGTRAARTSCAARAATPSDADTVGGVIAITACSAFLSDAPETAVSPLAAALLRRPWT